MNCITLIQLMWKERSNVLLKCQTIHLVHGDEIETGELNKMLLFLHSSDMDSDS